MIYEVDVKKRDVDEVVDEWMEANESVWRTWLP
jgi:ABC-type proline/glycine betaine transport system substrate-binding protein